MRERRRRLEGSVRGKWGRVENEDNRGWGEGSGGDGEELESVVADDVIWEK
jgi:hypothetical protein